MSDSYGRATGPRAGFWIRFVAAFADGIVLLIVELVLRLALHGVGALLAIIVSIAYFTSLEGGPSGQTLGKTMVGIRLVDTNTGGPIGYGRAAIRWFGRYVSLVVILLGYFWMLWDPERQCWHDKFASDYVVPVASYPIGGGTPSGSASTWR